MYATPAVSLVTIDRPRSPQGFFIRGQESREKTHFINTLHALNAQLRDMDVPHRIMNRDRFVTVIQEALDRLTQGVPEKKWATVFMALSGETKLPAKATIAELASGKFGIGKSDSAAYARFTAGLGMAGRVAFVLLSESKGHTAVFNAEFTTEDIGALPARQLDGVMLRGGYGDKKPPIYEVIPDEKEQGYAYRTDTKASAPYENPQYQDRLRTGKNPTLYNTYDADTEQSKRDTDERIAQTREDMGYHRTVITSKARNLRQQETNAGRIALEQNIAAELLEQDGRKLAELEIQASRAEEKKMESTAKLTSAFKITEHLNSTEN